MNQENLALSPFGRDLLKVPKVGKVLYLRYLMKREESGKVCREGQAICKKPYNFDQIKYLKVPYLSTSKDQTADEQSPCITVRQRLTIQVRLFTPSALPFIA